MKKVAILSIQPEFAEKILSHSKTIELRKSSMGLQEGDIILVYISAPSQKLGFWFVVANIETLGIKDMWIKYGDVLGIDYERYMNYFDGCPEAVGIHVKDLCPFNPTIPLSRIQELVPDFMPPQGILWIKNDNGRFEKLLDSLRPPLPSEAFPQQSLFAAKG